MARAEDAVGRPWLEPISPMFTFLPLSRAIPRGTAVLGSFLETFQLRQRLLCCRHEISDPELNAINSRFG